MKRKSIVLAVLVLVILGSAIVYNVTSNNFKSQTSSDMLSDNNEAAKYRKITGEEAKKLMDKNADAIILDVRTAEEYAESHIENAVLIPDNELAARAEAELPNKDSMILVYCRSGRRSAASANTLVKMGYTNVYDFGGIIDYPYETISN